jgi:hypothetical protein
MAPLLAALFVILTTVPSGAQELRPYSDPRFGTSAEVPAGWRSTSVEQGSGVSGRYFHSPDGETWIAVFGRTVAANVNPRAASIAPDERVTYRADGPGWFVRSGLRGDRIFYRKALISCGGRVAHLMAFEYPASRKRDHDRLVTVMSRSLRGANEAAC